MFSQPSHLILFLVDCLWVVGDLLLSFVMRSRIGPLIGLLPIAIGSPLCKMSMRPLRIKQRTRNFAGSARFLNPSGGQHIKHLCLHDVPKAGDRIVFITLRLSRVCIFILHDTAYTRSEYILGQGIVQNQKKRKMNDA